MVSLGHGLTAAPASTTVVAGLSRTGNQWSYNAIDRQQNQMFQHSILLVLFSVLMTCSGLGAQEGQPRRAFEGKNAPVEFEGVVLKRLPSPRIWSGGFATFQGVRYSVTKVVSGPMEPGDHIVYHVLVGPPLCERNEPVLSRRIFRVGPKLHVRGEGTPAGDCVGWEKANSVQILK